MTLNSASSLRKEDEDILHKIHDNDDDGDQSEAKENAADKRIGRYLLKSRSIFLFESIKPKVTRRLITQLLFLNQRSAEEPIKLFINSPGGVADDGLAIYDTIKFIDAPVKTIVCGLAASAAAIILVGAKKENRLALPHSRIMIHQPLGGVRGSTTDIEISAAQIVQLREQLNRILADETGQPIEKVAVDTNRDCWLTPDEAMQYGMISRIVDKVKNI